MDNFSKQVYTRNFCRTYAEATFYKGCMTVYEELQHRSIRSITALAHLQLVWKVAGSYLDGIGFKGQNISSTKLEYYLCIYSICTFCENFLSLYVFVCTTIHVSFRTVNNWVCFCAVVMYQEF